MVVTVVGFILTGILGAVFTWKLNSIATEHEDARAEQTKQAELLAATHDRAVEAVRQIIDLINERRTRAVLVAYSIRREASQKEVEDRKKAYDEIYVRWNTKSQSIDLQIRELFKQIAPSDYERYVDSLTFRVSPVANGNEMNYKPGLLSILDKCVTDAFDAYRKENFQQNKMAMEIIYTCNIDEIDSSIMACSQTMGESLFAIVSGQLKREEIDRKIGRDRDRIKAVCETPDYYT